MVHSFLVSFSGFGIRLMLVSENDLESILSTSGRDCRELV